MKSLEIDRGSQPSTSARGDRIAVYGVLIGTAVIWLLGLINVGLMLWQ